MSRNPKFEAMKSGKVQHRPSLKLAVVFPSALSGQLNESERIYMPPEWAWDLVLAWVDPQTKATVEARCKAARISKVTYYTHVKDSRFVQWFQSKRTELLKDAHDEPKLEMLRVIRTTKDVRLKVIAIEKFEELYGVRSQSVVIESAQPIRNVTPSRSAPYPPLEERSARYRQLMADVIENQIKKAKAYGREVPKDWQEVASAIEAEDAVRDKS